MSKTTNVASATPEEVRKLRDAVRDMDSFSQGGFGQIAAISSLAIDALQSPEGHHLVTLLYALRAINGIAHDFMDCIGSEAQDVGCANVDKGALRVIAKQHPECLRGVEV